MKAINGYEFYARQQNVVYSFEMPQQSIVEERNVATVTAIQITFHIQIEHRDGATQRNTYTKRTNERNA